MSHRSTTVAVLAGAALALGVAGCGGLPTASGVQIVRGISAGAAGADDTGDVRVLPPGPTEGAGPEAVVRGFLNAQADDSDDYAVAREFLAPGTRWDTGGAVSVYAAATYTAGAVSPPVPVTPSSGPTSVDTTGTQSGAQSGAQAGGPVAGQSATVSVALARAASLDAAGAYTPRSDTVRETFRLSLVGGAWRIDTPPAGLQLTAGDLQRSYEPQSVWWFAPGGSLLVPELRWLPSAPSGVQTRLVRALLAGPSRALTGAVRTDVPSGVSLDGSVATVGPDIVVDLSPQAATLGGVQARAVLLQLGRTLQQAPTGSDVRLLVDGQPLPSADAPVRLTLAAATALDPETPVAQAPPVALVAGRLRVLSTGSRSTLSPTAVTALAGRTLLAAVPSPVGGRIAVLVAAPGGERLLVSGPTGTLRQVGPVGSYAAPSWSLDGTLVAAGPRALLLQRSGGAVVSVPYPAGLPGPVSGAALARDGVRLLLVAGPAGARAAFATALRTAGTTTSMGPPAPLSPGLGDVSVAAWQGATSLVLLVTPSGGPPQVTEVGVDGSQPVSVPLPTSVGTGGLKLAAAEGGPVLLAGAGRVETLTGDSVWQPVGIGTAPAVPG